MRTDRNTGNSSGPEAGRLDSWKEIAAHLGRSTRTVQRWEKEEGLPVHRRETAEDDDKANQKQVFAYKSEIDAWWRRFAGESAAANSAQSEPSQAQHSRLKHRLFIAALVVIIVGTVIWQIERGQTEAALTTQAVLEKVRDTGHPLDATSPDGQRTAVMRDDRSLWLESIDGSTVPRLLANEVRGGPAWSPDSRSVLVTGMITDDHRCVTRIFNLDTGTEKDVLECGPSSPNFWAWRPPGKELLVSRELDNERITLELLDIETGEFTSLFEGRKGMWQWTFSPDGQMLAYIFTTGETKYDIYVRHMTDLRELQVTEHPAADYNPTWSPDGSHILFFSDRTGARSDLWAVPVGRGGPLGRPRVVQVLGGYGVGGLQMHADGSLTYTSKPPTEQLALLRIHPTTGALIEEVANDFLMGSQGATWFDGGRTLKYFGAGLVARDMATGQEQPWIHPKIPFQVRIVADGGDRDPRVFWGGVEGGVIGFYELSDDYSEARLILEDSKPVNPPMTLSPDGTEVLYEHRPGVTPEAPRRPHAVLALNIQDGSVREVGRSRGRAYARWSPDGSQIAYTDGLCLTVAPGKGGAAREVICGPGPPAPQLGRLGSKRGQLSWSPDGTKVAWTMSHVERKAIDIWIVDIATGAHHVLWTGEGNYESWPELPAWSPAGDLLAFDKNFQQRSEVWRLSNFWPPPGFRLPR